MEEYHEDLSGQSQSITIRLSAGSKLRVYAKTDRRVRFEVVQEGREISKLCGGRTTTNSTAMESWIGILTTDVAQKLNFVLSELPEPQITTGLPSAVGLLHTISRCAVDEATANVIAGILITYGRLVVGKHDRLKSSIHNLRVTGVLRTLKPRSNICVVTDEYLPAYKKLRDLM